MSNCCEITNTIVHLLTIDPQTLDHAADEATNQYHTTSKGLTVVIQPHCLGLSANSVYVSFLLIVASHVSKIRYLIFQPSLI